MPDWAEVQRELRGKHVTLALLWQEYKEHHPDGIQSTAGFANNTPSGGASVIW
jgi:transposase